MGARLTDPNPQPAPAGYTLIELVVVVALIGVLFLFTLPRFQASLPFGQSKRFSRRLMNTVRILKEASVRDGADYILVVNIDEGSFRSLSTAPPAGEGETDVSKIPESLSRNVSFEIPESMTIRDLEFPMQGKIGAGTAEIRFYRGGWSDKVLIHVATDSRESRTYSIEPFLNKVEVFYEDVGFSG